MTALASYSTGTITVAAGGTVVTGVGSIWSGTNVKPGDVLHVGNFQSVITDVTDTTHLVVPPWGGGAQTAVAYQIWQVSPQRFAGAQAMQTVNDLVAALNATGFFWFVGVGATAPDPSLGDDGQYAYQPSTGAYWVKSGGVWVASGSPAAGYGGTSTTSLAIGTGTKAFTTQSGLAYNGARVRATATSDVTKWLEGPATYSGTTLTISADKSNGAGTIAIWAFAIAGQPATGDMVAANNLSDVASAQTSRGNLGILSPPQGRLTLVSGTAVMSTSQAAKTTLYYTPHTGNQIPLYDGTNVTMTAFAELSVATTDTTKNPAAIGASKVNDWFVWNDGGTLRLSHGPDWTSDSARSAGTVLVKVNGLWLNNAGITNGPAASRGTYVGTTRSDASSQLSWVFGGVGVPALLNVWNTYNRVAVAASVSASAGNWSYTSATVRQAGALPDSKISFVSGLAEDPVSVDLSTQANMPATASGFCQMGFAMDSTTTFDNYRDPVGIAASTITMPACPIKAYTPQLGYHFVSQNEAGDGTNATLFFGAAKSALRLQTRM